MHDTEDLNDKLGFLDEATIPTEVFIVELSLALFAPVLNFDEVDVRDETADLDDVTDNLVRGNSFKQLDSVIGLEVIHFFFYSPHHFEVILEKLDLNVDIKVVGDLS